MIYIAKLGELEPSGLPLKIVNAEIGPAKKQDGSQLGEWEALNVQLERLHGDHRGETFWRAYGTFRKTPTDKIGGSAAKFIRAAAKVLGTKTIDDTDVLLNRSFLFEGVSKTNKNTGKTFEELFPVALPKQTEPTLASSDNRA